MATENKMGVMPLNRLLISMSVPMMISMLVQALYNIVDSMFVAQLSENALTAVSLAFPAQNLMIAVATGTGVGVNAALSRNLGEKNFDRANRIADHALFLAAMSYIVFALFGLFFARQFFRLQTDIEEIVDLGTTYLRICTIASFGLFMEIACERLLQSTGKTIYSMYTQGLGAIINIVLDPILIFGYFGAPALGIAGAAGATVFGQIIAFCLGFYLNKTKNHEITISLRSFKPNGEIIRHIYAVGVPSIIMASIGSIMTFGINKILIAFLFHGDSCIRCLLQAPELRVHAGLRFKQRNRSDHRLQLRCRKTGPDYGNHKACRCVRHNDHAVRLRCLPAHAG